MAGEPSPLMRVLGSHRLHQSGAGHRVEPEQAVRRRAIVLVEDHQVEVAPVQRCLTESLLDIGAAPSCHVVGPRSSLASGGQPIAGIERADRWPVPDVHPCLDGLVPGHLEAERGEDPDLGFVREVDGDLDPVQALSRGVGQSAFDDVRHPGRARARQHDRGEARGGGPGGGDHRGGGSTGLVEPEKLRERVGRTGDPPPPLEVGCLVVARGGVSRAHPPEEGCHRFQVLQSNQVLLVHARIRPRRLRPPRGQGGALGPRTRGSRRAVSSRPRLEPR